MRLYRFVLRPVAVAFLVLVCLCWFAGGTASAQQRCDGKRFTPLKNLADNVHARRDARHAQAAACAPAPMATTAAVIRMLPTAPSSSPCAGGSCPAPGRRRLFP